MSGPAVFREPAAVAPRPIPLPAGERGQAAPGACGTDLAIAASEAPSPRRGEGGGEGERGCEGERGREGASGPVAARARIREAGK